MKPVKEMFGAFVEQWHTSRLDFVLEAIGVTSSIIGALLISLGSPNPPLMLVFLFYTVGSVTIGWVSFRRKTFWILFLMIFYIMTNLIGMYNIVY